MHLRSVVLSLAFLGAASSGFAQASRRLAVVEMNGPLAKTIPAFAFAENSVTDMLNSKLAGQAGLTLVDRASIDKITHEQDFQNSDRASSDTAAKIGRVLGVSQIVMVNVYAGGFTTKVVPSFAKTKTMGTQTLRVNVRLLDVESATILAQPSSDFQDTVLVSEIPNFPPRPPGQQPPVDATVQEGEWNKACEAVTTDLAAKITAAVASAPGPKMPSALVAGIANGSVYINQGSASGIKVGNRFQIVREVSVGLNDPATGKPMVQRQNICVLTIGNASDTSASGSCQGGLPQSKDFAEPIKP